MEVLMEGAVTSRGQAWKRTRFDMLLPAIGRISLSASSLSGCSRGIAAIRLSVLAGVLVLAWFWRWSGVPLCLFHKFTGLDCPLCGCTRAFHAICHGDVAQAFGLNIFSPLIFGAVVLTMLIDALHVVTNTHPPIDVPERLRPHLRRAGIAAVAVLLGYGILRNIV